MTPATSIAQADGLNHVTLTDPLGLRIELTSDIPEQRHD